MYSRDNGTGTTKPQGCDVALCAMQLSQFVSFARGAQCRVARHVALRLLLLVIEGFARIIMVLWGPHRDINALRNFFFLIRVIWKRKGNFVLFFCK